MLERKCYNCHKNTFLFARSNTAFQNPVSLLKSEVFSLFTHANDEKSKQIIKHVKLKSAMTNLPKRYFVMTTWGPYRFFKKVSFSDLFPCF